MRTALNSFLSIAPLLLATTAEAALVRVDFAGVVTSHGGDMVAAMPLGTAGSGYFVYDTSTPATLDHGGGTRYDGALVDYAFTVGSYHYAFRNNEQTLAWMFDESSVGDRFDLGDWAGLGDSIAGHALFNWGLLIGRPSDGIVQGTALPGADWFTSLPELEATLLVDHDGGPADHRYQVQIRTLSTGGGPGTPPVDPGPDPTPVPEPAGLGLLSLAMLAGMQWHRRRRQGGAWR